MKKFKKGNKVVAINATITDSGRNPLKKGHIDIIVGISLDEERMWFKQDGNGSYSMKDFKLYEESVTIAPPQIVEPQRIESEQLPIYKIGDKVIITKSHQNWNKKMDQYDGKIVTIKTLADNKGFNASFEEEDRDMRQWGWNAHQGHFKHYKEPIQEFPQFTIVRQISTISENNVIKEVMNNEGNTFEINDLVIPLNAPITVNPVKIIKFRLTSNKTNVCAILENGFPNGVGIDKIQHFVKFKPKEPEFILPKKWCIKNTNNIIGKWFNEQIDGFSTYTNRIHMNMYLHNHNIDGVKIGRNIRKALSHRFIMSGFTEITLKQFKEYVLGEKPQTLQELPQQELPQEESLLDKAKRLYPVGTKFKNRGNCIVSVTHSGAYESTYQGGYSIESGGNVIFHDGIWAEIIKE